MSQGPPRVARLLVRLSAGRRDRDSVVQDLGEEFETMLREGASPRQARRWYWKQAAGSIVPLVGARRGPLTATRHFLGSEGGMMGDALLAARMLRKRPGFSSLVVLTLALGIGATSAVFSLIQGVLLTPPPYETPGRLALVSSAFADGREGRAPDWTPEQWLGWRQDSEAFESLSAYLWSFSFFVSDEGSEAVEGMRVTHDYFETLGLEPVIGRVFDAAETGGEDAPGAIILGYDLWMQKFGGDPGVLGQTVRMSREGSPPVVVGVMPPDVRFLPSVRASQEPNYDVDAKVDYWLPADPRLTSPTQTLQADAWSVVGRLRDDVAPAAAAQELRSLIEHQALENPRYAGLIADVAPLPAVMNAAGRRILLPLLAAAALVLLIACGNAAALLLVRGLQKQTEYGIRSAIGAGRLSLVRLVTVESLLLAGMGGALGIGLAVAIVRSFQRFAGHAIPRLDAVELGLPVILFGLGCAMLATVLAGVYPARRAASAAESGALRSASQRTTASQVERRVLAGVTATQAAMTLTLLVGAGLMIRTMGNLSRVDSGFDTRGVLTMSVTAMDGDYTDFHVRAIELVEALPGVESAAFAWGVPLTGNSWPTETTIEGRAETGEPDDRPLLPTRAITSGYFELLGRHVVEGRDFRPTDDRSSPLVAIVNQAFVDRFMDGAVAVGRAVVQRTQSFEIVGVVSDARIDDLTSGAEPEVYASLWQRGAFTKHLVVRVAGDPEAAAARIEQTLHQVSPTVGVDNVESLDRIRAASVAPQTFAMRLLVGFAVVAILLTLGGIYGVLSLSVAARRREIAIRTAIGAARRDVLRMVLREGVAVIAIGVAVGLLSSMGLSRILAVFLFDVEPTDPLTLIAVVTLFSAVAVLACVVPAHRATSVDPVQALQDE